jgi:hypothetical protein
MGALASLTQEGSVKGLLDLTLRCTKEVQATWRDPFYNYKFWRKVRSPERATKLRQRKETIAAVWEEPMGAPGVGLGFGTEGPG